MESQEQAQSADFPIQLRDKAELLEFAYMLASQCTHCSTKASLSLMAAKIYCGLCHETSKDDRFAEPRYILSYAIDAMMEAEADIANAEHKVEIDTAMKERAAARHVQ